VPACPSGIGNAYYRNFVIYIYIYILCRWRGCISKIGSNVGRAILGRNFDVTIRRAACEACSATWNLGTNSAFDLGSRKTLIELSGRRTFRMQTDF
jgi:hypothetical protein